MSRIKLTTLRTQGFLTTQRTILATAGELMKELLAEDLAEVFDEATGPTEDRLVAVFDALITLMPQDRDTGTCRHCGRDIVLPEFSDSWFHANVPGGGFTRGCKTVARAFGVSVNDAEALHRKYASP